MSSLSVLESPLTPPRFSGVRSGAFQGTKYLDFSSRPSLFLPPTVASRTLYHVQSRILQLVSAFHSFPGINLKKKNSPFRVKFYSCFYLIFFSLLYSRFQIISRLDFASFHLLQRHQIFVRFQTQNDNKKISFILTAPILPFPYFSSYYSRFPKIISRPKSHSSARLNFSLVSSQKKKTPFTFYNLYSSFLTFYSLL